MNNRYIYTLALASLLTLTSCVESAKKTTDSAGNPITYGQLKHFEDMVTRGDNAVEVLKQTLEDNSKVVVDFYAEWCGPCKKLGPVLSKLANKHTDVLFIKINVDEFRSISDHYSVKSLPTLMLYKNGKRVEKTTGFKSESDLKTMLKKLD